MRKVFAVLTVVMLCAFQTAFISCDFDDDDDTQIIVKNEATGGISAKSDYITEIEVRGENNRMAFYSRVSIGPGGSRTITLDEGMYRVKICVQTKDVFGYNIGSEAFYSTSQKYLSNGNTLDAVFNGNGFSFD